VADDYDILIALEEIFKTDYRTKEYIIQGAEEPDSVPSPDICPMVNIFPSLKERDLTRMSGTPYTANLTFDIMMWEMSVGDFKNAFKLISSVEENVYQVLLANKNVSSNVLTSEIGATEYVHIFYESCFYIKAVIPFTVQLDQ
jgi:hypothetical protein